MGLFNKVRRRGLIRTGLPSLATSTTVTPDTNAAIRPKTSGETKVVALFGTTDSNNGLGHELCIRKIFESKKGWRLIFVRANKFFTPQLISDADLLITCRDGSADPIDLFTAESGVAESVVQGSALWTDENVAAIIDNVRGRGMGLLALHNTVLCGNRRFMDFLDVRGIAPHMFEPMWYTRINKSHPVMRGIGKFSAMHDEQLAVIIKSASTATLFESTSVHEKRQAVSGWALEKGNGKIVGLLPGSTIHAYQAPEYQNILWRAAHWAMNRTIQPYPTAENRYYD
ncbi:ThuA domain-containing protein [Candidatus Latescibacterota bacterium]